MTAQQWGDLARNAFPGYTGARPRMQLCHGTTDTTLRYPNFGEEIKQWTNVLGLSQTPSSTDTPQSGWTRTRYGGTGVSAPVEGISVANVGHSLPLAGQARMAIQFFGLDTSVPAAAGAARCGWRPNAAPSARTGMTTWRIPRPRRASTSSLRACRAWPARRRHQPAGYNCHSTRRLPGRTTCGSARRLRPPTTIRSGSARTMAGGRCGTTWLVFVVGVGEGTGDLQRERWQSYLLRRPA